MKSTDIFICCSCIAVFLFCHTFIITVLINNAFKTVQQSAKDKEDICRHAITHGKDICRRISHSDGLDYDALFTRTAIDASIFVDFRIHHRHVGKI